MTRNIRRVCCVCKTTIAPEPHPREPYLESHGYCVPCGEAALADCRETLRDPEAPVALRPEPRPEVVRQPEPGGLRGNKSESDPPRVQKGESEPS